MIKIDHQNADCLPFLLSQVSHRLAAKSSVSFFLATLVMW